MLLTRKTWRCSQKPMTPFLIKTLTSQIQRFYDYIEEDG
ncbi:unnamed protein product [Larinioides sclopetarius]